MLLVLLLAIGFVVVDVVEVWVQVLQQQQARTTPVDRASKGVEKNLLHHSAVGPAADDDDGAGLVVVVAVVEFLVVEEVLLLPFLLPTASVALRVPAVAAPAALAVVAPVEPVFPFLWQLTFDSTDRSDGRFVSARYHGGNNARRLGVGRANQQVTESSNLLPRSTGGKGTCESQDRCTRRIPELERWILRT